MWLESECDIDTEGVDQACGSPHRDDS